MTCFSKAQVTWLLCNQQVLNLALCVRKSYLVPSCQAVHLHSLPSIQQSFSVLYALFHELDSSPGDFVKDMKQLLFVRRTITSSFRGVVLSFWLA